MSKFVGKFRKNKDYHDDNETLKQYMKVKKRKNESAEVKKLRSRSFDDNHEHHGSYEFLDG